MNVTQRARSSSVDETPSQWSLVRELLLREHVLGTVVYVCSVAERTGNALLGLALMTCAVLWSCWNGIIPPLRWCRFCTALVESALLYIGAIAVANVLRLLFGQPSVGW